MIDINGKRRGFTLVELLIVIVVIGILAAMMMLSSTEAVTTAKASNIIANLKALKKATLAWYMDNRNKVQEDGRVKLFSDRDPKPIQEWQDSELRISDYFNNHVQFTYNSHDPKYDPKARKNTPLDSGSYGIYDAGLDENDKPQRRIWYVGYHFKDGEDAVRDKVKKRAAVDGLFFTDEPDPYDIVKIERDNADKPENEWRINGEHIVWLNVF